MDATTFNAELSKYKVIRKPDYYRIRMNHNTQFKSLGKPAIQARITAAPVTNNRIENPRAGTENFWELLELHFASTIGSTSDVQKFIKAMKEEHEMLPDKVNLEDLEYIVSNY